MKVSERLSEHTRSLPPLAVGDTVRIQNQVGPNPTKWDKTGFIIEVRQFDQYVVRVDGSGRVTLRNRKFLRKYIPVVLRAPVVMLPGNTSSMNPAAPTGRTPMVASPPLVQAQHPVAPAATMPQAPPSAGPVSPSPSRHPGPTTHIAPPASTTQLTQVPPMMTSHDAAPTDTPETLSNPAVVNPAPPKRIPRALRALMPYNQPGLQETTTLSYESYIPEPMRRTTRMNVKK